MTTGKPTLRWEALLSGALGAAVGLASGLLLASRPAETRGLPTEVGSESAQASLELLTELRAIRELLVERSLLPVAPSAEREELADPGEATAARPSGDELVAALLSLEAAVRTAGAGALSTAVSPPAGLRASAEGVGTPLPADLGALRTARASLEGQGQQVVPDLFGLSPAQVYERFGTPAIVGNSPGRVRWLYEDPDYPGHLVVTFMDGYVSWLHVTTE